MMTLEEFFKENNKVALGFSGGVDSSYLLYAGLKYGADIKPYLVKGAFQPEFEKDDAMKLANKLGVNVTILPVKILEINNVAENSTFRCYYCKRKNFNLIIEAAKKDGYDVVIDGTNYSDDINDRPGYKALQEMNVLSPLRLAGLTKDDIRKLSCEAGLPTWNKPAYACLATRIPTGMRITADLLRKVEKSEKLMSKMGFRDFRVRLLDMGNTAKLQLTPADMKLAIEKRTEVLAALESYFKDVYLDLKSR